MVRRAVTIERLFAQRTDAARLRSSAGTSARDGRLKAVAVIAFLVGLLLGVRVMFFGVQRRIDEEHLTHRRWPLALAASLVALGALLYARVLTGRVTGGWLVAVVFLSACAGAGAWWLVVRSAAVPSTDPEDDPRYRFQGHVARIVEPIGAGLESRHTGRIAFDFDGKRHELQARWLPTADGRSGGAGARDTEVVIERVDGEVAYVEPWSVVEERL